MNATSRATALFLRELELCRVAPAEMVVIVCEPESRSDYAEAAFAGGSMLGASVAVLTLPAGSPVPFPSTRTGSAFGLRALEDERRYVDFLRSADLVVDLTREGFIHTPVLSEILDAHTRVLFVCDPIEVLERNMPHPDDKKVAAAHARILEDGESMRIRSDVGTDLTVAIVDSAPGFQCGFTDEPGRWDHWPSKMVMCWPRPDGVNGTVVIAPGDVVFPFKEYVRSPVTLSIEEGRIADVAGNDVGVLIREFLESSRDSNAWLTSHMGWGLLETADWSALSMYDKESLMGMDARSYAGNFLISTGPSPFLDRWTAYHLDIPMRGCSIEIDGQLVVDRGTVVAS